MVEVVNNLLFNDDLAIPTFLDFDDDDDDDSRVDRVDTPAPRVSGRVNAEARIVKDANMMTRASSRLVGIELLK